MVSEDVETNPPDGHVKTEGAMEIRYGKFQTWWNKAIWHGGSLYDAWFNAVSAQVGQVILSMPYSYSQMGFGLGLLSQILYASVGCWTCYLLSCLYLEYRSRKEKEGVDFSHHVIQYHEVMGYLVGPWAKKVTLMFNILAVGSVCVVQIIACASNAYYLSSKLDKQQYTFIFGAVAMLTALLPTIHNFRVWSILGVVTTTYTAWYMWIAALVHGQVSGVKHSAPQSLESFFTGATNMLFAFGGHAITVEIMHAMWKPRKYKFVYLLNCLYVVTLTVPHSIVVYWAYGDTLLKHSNAFSVLPPSPWRSIGLVFMIIHQAVAFGLYVMPLNFMWEKLLGVHQGRYIVRVLVRIPVVAVLWFLALLLPFFGPLNSVIGAFFLSFPTYILPCIGYVVAFRSRSLLENASDKPAKWMPGWKGMMSVNSSVGILVLVLGVGFGGWASISNLVKQVHTFGVFDKCYQCS